MSSYYYRERFMIGEGAAPPTTVIIFDKLIDLISGPGFPLNEIPSRLTQTENDPWSDLLDYRLVERPTGFCKLVHVTIESLFVAGSYENNITGRHVAWLKMEFLK